MSFSFNLIDRPFLACADSAGAVREYGLAEALSRAHELTALHDDSPLVEAALFRFLLAILHRNFGPADQAAWKKLYAAGRFDAAVLDRYFREWHGRFDLFHERFPFYQSPRPMLDGVEPNSVNQLVRQLSGAFNVLFEHTSGGTETAFAWDWWGRRRERGANTRRAERKPRSHRTSPLVRSSRSRRSASAGARAPAGCRTARAAP